MANTSFGVGLVDR